MNKDEQVSRVESPESIVGHSAGPDAMVQAEQSEISGLTEQLKKLVAKLDAPKRKDLWDILSALTPFLATVIVSGLGLYLTQSFQRLEAQRTHDFQAKEAARAALFSQSQIENQRAQIRVEELKAITALAPLLASPDANTRKTGQQLLQAVHETGAPSAGGPEPDPPAPRPASVGALDAGNRGGSRPMPSLLDQFATIALSSDVPPGERVAATRKIGEIATAPETSRAVRDRAADIAARIATTGKAPPEVKQAASEVIEKIKLISPADAEKMISSQPTTRKITEVILHHSGSPAGSYKGAESLLALARFELEQRGWHRVSWHFAIAPDGSIWLGAPLNEPAIHTLHHQEGSVSVMLVMDGNKELPTQAQRSSLAVVLRSLFAKLKIQDALNSPPDIGFHFHSDYQQKLCPGSQLTKDMVLAWR